MEKVHCKKVKIKRYILNTVVLVVFLLLFRAFTSEAAPIFVINEILADPDGMYGDANYDGTVNTTQDEFIELVNITASSVDISLWTLSDSTQIRHVFPEGTVIGSGCAIVVFSGGNPLETEWYFTTIQTASSGGLGLNNDGDTVTLKDNNSMIIATYTYGVEGGNNQSLTLAPDLTIDGILVQHCTASMDGSYFSPGFKLDGSEFASSDSVPVPEPITLILLGVSLLGIGVGRKEFFKR